MARWLTVACLVLALTASGVAFKTFSGMGGAIHTSILYEALQSEVAPDILAQLDAACASQDDPRTGNLDLPSHHYDDCLVVESAAYIHERQARALELAPMVDLRRDARDAALLEAGLLFHTLQDFYSHSNYVELVLWTGKPADQIGPAYLTPPGLVTGYFHGEHLWDNELVRSRDTCNQAMQGKHTGVVFPSDDQIALVAGNPRTYQGALALGQGQFPLLHWDLNKDSPSTLQGAPVDPVSGLTLHEIARRVAVRHTAEFWRDFLVAVRSRSPRPDSAEQALCGFLQPGVTVAVAPTNPSSAWTAEVREVPLAGAADHWSLRFEVLGTHKIVYLVQDPARNPFDRQRPDLAASAGAMAEMGSSYASMRQAAEESCQRFRTSGQ